MPLGAHGSNESGFTLASLHPATRFTPSWNIPRHSARPSGTHRLTHPRPTREGVSSRPYAAGDPPRSIDWKTLARTDHLVLRQDRPESSASVAIVLDCSDSMLWPDTSVPRRVAADIPLKIEIAGRVAFHLAHAHTMVGDRVTICPLRDHEPLPTRRLSSMDPITLVGLHELWSEEGYKPDHLLENSVPRDFEDDRYDLCVWIGDLLGAGSVEAAAPTCRSIVCVQTLSSLERDVRWCERDTCYFDLSRHQREYRGHTLTMGHRYHEALASWIASRVKSLRDVGVEHLLVDERSPVGTLHDFLVDSVAEGAR